MAIGLQATACRRDRHWLRAAAIIGRAAVGLLVHALLRPGRPAAIERTTGKVVAR